MFFSKEKRLICLLSSCEKVARTDASTRRSITGRIKNKSPEIWLSSKIRSMHCVFSLGKWKKLSEYKAVFVTLFYFLFTVVIIVLISWFSRKNYRFSGRIRNLSVCRLPSEDCSLNLETSLFQVSNILVQKEL
jgi:hypothetical protein